MSGAPRVGVLGGSFNPVHFGHLLMADQVAERLALERVLFVPAGSPPHKPPEDLAPDRDRLAMIRLAVQGHPVFEVSDVEFRRSGPSYTVDTLEALAGRGDLHLVIGSDSFLELTTWREPRLLAARARLVVVPRAGHDFAPDQPAARKILRGLGLAGFRRVAVADGGEESDAGQVLIADVVSLPLSGSDLRRRAREGRSLAFRMPDAVIDYIRRHRLYGSPPA